MIFSKRVDKIHMKMLENNVKYRIAIETSYQLFDYCLFFRNSVIFAMRLTRPVIAFIKKNIDFLPKGRLNSCKNAWEQRKVQNHNENKLLFHWITGSCSEIACYWQRNLLSLKQCLLNKHWFCPKGWIKLHENAWEQRKVQNHNEIKLLFHWITGSCSEIACYWQWNL